MVNSSLIKKICDRPDDITNSGQTVASFLGDTIHDDQPALQGIAVSGLASGNGEWQYSLDGTTWSDVGTVSADAALLLKSTDYIRFVPDGKNGTTASFSYHAWDQTTGQHGETGDASVNGDATAFSTQENTASITVSDVNDAPTVVHALSDEVFRQGQSIRFAVPADSFADLDKGDTLSYVATLANGTDLPGWLKFDEGTQTFTSASAVAGTISVKVTAIDGSKASVSDTFNIVVTNPSPPSPPPNHAPLLASPIAGQAVDQDAAFSFVVPSGAFTDSDGDALTYAATLENGAALPAWLHFDAATRTFSGTPGNDDVGAVSIKLTASDGRGGSASTVFAVTVADVNDAPELDRPLAGQTGNEGQAFTFQVADDTFGDIDAGDVLTYTATLDDGSPLPAWLTFDAATRTFSGTPGHADIGSVSVTVTAIDKAGATATDTFDLTISSSGASGGSVVLSNATVEENSKPRTLVGILSTPDAAPGTSSTYDLIKNPHHAFAIKGDHLVVAHGADLDFETKSHYMIKVRAIDDLGNHVTQRLIIDITDVEETPRGTRHDDILIGDAFGNKIFARAGDDIVKGHGGDDKLAGGRGHDRLTGGDGADMFVFARHSGRDIITDFHPDEGDTILMKHAVGIADYDDLINNHIKVHGHDLVITADHHAIAVLKHTEIGDLDAKDFLF